MLQRVFWKGQCCVCNGVLPDAVALARRVRHFCPFGGEKQQRSEAREILSADLGTPCCALL